MAVDGSVFGFGNTVWDFMRVDLITISYCSLPVYLKSFDSRKTCVIDIDNNDISGQRHCCVCLDNACHCLESCRAVWRSAEVHSACLRPSSVATVSEDTTCRHTNAYSNPLHGAVSVRVIVWWLLHCSMHFFCAVLWCMPTLLVSFAEEVPSSIFHVTT